MRRERSRRLEEVPPRGRRAQVERALDQRRRPDRRADASGPAGCVHRHPRVRRDARAAEHLDRRRAGFSGFFFCVVVVVVEGKRRHREAISRLVRRLAVAEDVGGGDLDVSNLRVGVRGGERGVDEHGGDRGTTFGERSGGTARFMGVMTCHRGGWFARTSEESRRDRRRRLQRSIQLARGVAQLADPRFDVTRGTIVVGSSVVRA
mmetsp:Transcript_1876/g.8314  ORF Transcript_1876/g.8314 Transcript_1876/m.8314 type:complete len:206 (+) Transcript_1876:995-1612(+)